MKHFVVVLAVAVCCLAVSDAFRLRREDVPAAAAAEAQPAAGTDDKAAENPEDLAERYGHRRPGYSTYTSQTYTSVNHGGAGFGAGHGGVGYGASAGYPSGVGYSGSYGAAGYGPGYEGAGAAGYRPSYAGAGAAGYEPGYAGAGAAGYGPSYAGAGAAGYGPGYAGAGYAGSGYGGGVRTPYGAVPNVNFQSVGPNGRPAVSYESPNFGFYLRDKNAANGEASAASAGAEAEKPKDAEAVAFGGSR